MQVKEKCASIFLRILLCCKNIIKIEAKFSILFYQFRILSTFTIDLLSTIFVSIHFYTWPHNYTWTHDNIYKN